MLEEASLLGTLMRQVFRTHRPFKVTVFSTQMMPLLTVYRHFSLINSKVYVEDMGSNLVGEVHQEWHIYKRRYNLFNSSHVQFGRISSGFLSWHFEVRDITGKAISSIGRNFIGLARELFTDMGKYVLRMDPSYLVAERSSSMVHPYNQQQHQQQQQYWYPSNDQLVDACEMTGVSTRLLTYDERAVLLANAISIDFDYFSRSSRPVHF
ncbi:Altered inheritance rate of mitochondria protein 25 [Smittium culicis]|uniref:Phospholipid scramblase n=1 Tax=Smittium culicis TaxID=133412 RepID=A0A1R1YPE6_9FUNG|nr:Altered inheritance rate of mitochondria protein 25 [Smittium culicis]